MSIIEVNSVTKEFNLGHLKNFKQTIVNGLNYFRGDRIAKVQSFKAIEDLSFNVQQGEVVGIIGHNGAGKSTLLKILARISVPTRGSISVKGKVAPLIEVGAGLVGDLTGRENIYLNATILGLSRKEIDRKFDDIVEFAELEEFIDTPIKRYSSGMAVRLGFSIATSVESDILIVDEVMAVGDLAFQRKCLQKMEDMIKRQGKTVLLVSHNMRQIERICSRAILLEKGKLIADGIPSSICNLFYEKSDEKIKNTAERKMSRSLGRYETTGEIELLGVSILDDNNKELEKIKHGSNIKFIIRYKFNNELSKPVFGFGIHTTDFLYLATDTSYRQLSIKIIKPGEVVVECKMDNFQYMPGVYSLRVGVAVGEFYSTAFYAENVKQFQVYSEVVTHAESMREGFFAMNAIWKIEEK